MANWRKPVVFGLGVVRIKNGCVKIKGKKSILDSVKGPYRSAGFSLGGTYSLHRPQQQQQQQHTPTISSSGVPFPSVDNQDLLHLHGSDMLQSSHSSYHSQCASLVSLLMLARFFNCLQESYFVKFSMDTLFFVFFSMPKDEAQLYAANELYALSPSICCTNLCGFSFTVLLLLLGYTTNCKL
ncbi:hypothetical protein RHMOL_Rhmol02G0014000 [Rhododendron molle]|uniref:Uncharacterized protein n=1 Tax=Rhododendron molle TaxID=49168 RepID=A0ACC0PM01_RHOML|nr:hypothetical protein RHMOL_Rhmol02G0014000 [Rhododendron molle]